MLRMINTIVLASGRLFPGAGVDAVDQSAVEAQGGILVDDADANILAGAQQCEQMRLRGGELEDMVAVMQTAYNKRQDATASGQNTVDSTTATNTAATATNNTATTGITSAHAIVRKETFKLPAAAGTDLSTTTAKADSQPKSPSAHTLHGRNVQLATGSWASSATVDVVLTGTTMDGQPAQTETITIPTNGATVQGLKAWADAPTITSWQTPAGWTAGTFKMQTGTKLGLPTSPGGVLSILKEVKYVDATPTPTYAANGTFDATYNTYVPTTSMDGLTDLEITYKETITVSVTDSGHTHVQASHNHTQAAHTHTLS